MLDDVTFAELKRVLAELLGLDLDGYKEAQVRRRLQAFITKHGGPVAYLDRVGHDPELLRATREMLTINVTEFFRDRAHWERFGDLVLPALVERRGVLKVWSAGCSHGQEALSLAILLDEAGVLRRSSILATDFDRIALARARTGGPYTLDEVRGLSEEHLAAYFTQREGGYWASPALLRRLRHREVNLLDAHDLVDDVSFEGFDLIVCRNVMIYFEADAKSALIRRLRDALRPGGVLFIGATEALLGADTEGLERLGGNCYGRSGSGRADRAVA